MAPDPEPPPAAAPATYMSCSECRATMRDRYFALNERPICAKCRPVFAKRIERGTTAAAFRRAALHGLLTAFAGAAVLGTGVLFIPFVRIFVVIGVGHFIGKRVMAAVDGYGGRRYQILAVALTYFAIGLGSLVPAINEANEAADRQRAIRADTTRRLATQGKAIAEELDAFVAEQAGAEAKEGAGAEDSIAAEEAAAVRKRPAAKEANGPGIGDLLIALLTLPVLAMFAFGYTAAAVGLFTFGYALREAWRLTDGQGLVLELRGPFRVGAGPIPPAL
ncbi:MAG: hypothetical protein M3303_02545 [Gemmatimonadota bacterium]|nr:hypothetical protein [Gemmatimonadota bacterium]